MLGPAPASGLRSFRQTLSSQSRQAPSSARTTRCPAAGASISASIAAKSPAGGSAGGARCEQRRRERLDLRRGGTVRPGPRQRPVAAEAEPVQGVTPVGHCNAFRSVISPRRTQVFAVPTGTFKARATSSWV